MPFKATYIAQASPVWPMDYKRAAQIVHTIGRAMRSPSHPRKNTVLTKLVAAGSDLHANFATITASQATFDDWISVRILQLQAVPFRWSHAGGTSRSTLSFGAAQKFVNLVVKDWWALSPHATAARTAVLHGPLDQIVYSATARYCGTLPSLRSAKGMYRSYVYNLTTSDYLTYQNHLQQLGVNLSHALWLPGPLSRIETEQMIWGCVGCRRVPV